VPGEGVGLKANKPPKSPGIHKHGAINGWFPVLKDIKIAENAIFLTKNGLKYIYT
jgi:hypothetical protein